MSFPPCPATSYACGRAPSGGGEETDVELQPGHIFGNFEIVQTLGKGATGTVYKARQTNLGRECALKVLAPELVRDGKFLDRFRREGQIAAALRHNNIVRIFDLVEAEGAFAIAMDLIDGVELQKLLENGEKLSVTRSLRIMHPVFESLEYAHSKGVVHRDIKPANILIEDGTGEAFLTDFSIARMAGADKLTQTGTIIGTPEYMAPEQFDGKDVDGRADLYAAMLILYEMLAGSNPFRGDTLAEVVKKQILVDPPPLRDLTDIPAPLEAIIHKGLSKSPDERFQTAKEIKELLASFSKDESTTLIEPSPQRSELLQHFLDSVESGQVSMDDAIIAREKMKEAIDRGFKRQLSIVMLDLAGSSKIKVPNQTLIADRAFRDYRATINAILEEQGCERYDWSGDGAIALFTEPIPAVTAAVKVQQSVESVGGRHSHLPDTLKVRIGIRTGLVYHDPRRSLGEFASRTVDQAGHLEKDCPPGMIHIGDETAKAVSGLYPARHVGKNRDDVEVYEINVAALGDLSTAPLPQQPLVSASSVLPQALTPSAIQAPPVTTPPAESFTPLRAQAAEKPIVQSTKQSLKARDVLPASEAPVESSHKPAPQVPIIKVGPLTEATPGGPSSDSTGPWWGWRYLGLAFFLHWGSSVLSGFMRFPEAATNLFRGVFAISVMCVPPYVLYALLRGRANDAKQSAIAFVVFFIGLLFVVGST